MTMRALLLAVAIGTGVLALSPGIDRAPAEFVEGRLPEPAQAGGRAAAPPRQTVDVSMPSQTGRRIDVPAKGDLQAAINQAQPGDVIALAPDGVYRGPFRLPRKDGTGWIVITSAATDRLPQPGRRVTPTHVGAMPKLRSPARHVVTTEAGAHHYRFVGLDVAPADGAFLYSLFQLGDDERDAGAQPTHIVIDRCHLRGDPRRGSRRGVALNGRDLAVVDSYLADFKEAGADSQAIAGWNGAGPFRIANNYLEAAGENVMFGGADPSIDGLVPADIEIVGNHLRKPLRWKAGDADFEGTAWTVKNLFELKNARRVRVEGNLFERNWPAAQNGFAILFTVRNQDGRAPWSVVEDVRFAGNMVRDVAAGVNILGRDDIHRSQQTSRIEIHDNLFLDVGGQWGSGRLFQLLDGTRDVTIAFNTALHSGGVLFGGDHEPHQGFAFTHNLVHHNGQGISGSGSGAGLAAIRRYFPDAVIRDNVIVGGEAAAYPADNTVVRTLAEAGLTREPDGGYRQDVSRCGGGRGERCAGADLVAIAAAMAEVSAASDIEVERTREVGSAATVFWGAGALLVYVYLGYPLIAAIRASFRRPPQVAPLASLPAVSIVLVAHNEANVIAARLENLRSIEYPREKLEILVGSDGSTDATADRARAAGDDRVHVLAFRQRRGKPAVINDLVAQASGEVVVFADARQRFDRHAIMALIRPLADPSIGAVSGELVLLEPRGASAAARGAGFYWRYEKLIRAREGRAGSLVGATGAIYAIRRTLFEPIPHDTILDDVLIPMRIVRQGYRVVWQPEAVAYDHPSADASREYARKVRTIAGTFQLFARERWMLNPTANPVWFATVSHKALRLTIPVLHGTLAAASLMLATIPFYAAMIAAQAAFYLAALGGHLLPRTARRPLIVAVPYAMCILMTATIAGFLRFFANRQPVTWDRRPTVAQHL